MDSNYIQLNTGYLTLPTGANFPITLEFKSVRKGFGTGGFSQSLEIDGTAENSRLLGLYFDVDLENEDFDRNKKTECTVVQNGVEVFTGFIQLMKISRVNNVNSTNAKSYKYKINVFDEVANFFIEMGEKELTDLSFPKLNHTFNRSNIIASWDNTEGYIYPQYAIDGNIYTLKDFKPAIFELDYFKKIFDFNGYTFTFEQLTDPDIRLDKRIIPFNGESGTDEFNLQLKENYTVIGEDEELTQLIDESTISDYPIGFIPFIDYVSSASLGGFLQLIDNRVSFDTVIQDSQFQWNSGNDTIQNLAGDNRNWTFLSGYDYRVDVRAGQSGVFDEWKAVFNQSGATRCDVILSLVAISTTDTSKSAYIGGQSIYTFQSGNSYSFPAGWTSLASGDNQSVVELGLFDNNEEIKIVPIIMARYYDSNGDVQPYQSGFSAIGNIAANNLSPLPTVVFTNLEGNEYRRLNFDIEITNCRIKAYPDITELVKDSIINMSSFIPRDIKQRDLIASIQKSYNLVFAPDPDDNKNIIIKTRDKYYDDGDEWDWTAKIAEDQKNTIEFLSNEVNRDQKLMYKDDDDFINEAYQKQYSEPYGTTSIRLDNEYTKGQDEKELIYAPTPSIMAGIGKVLPSINGINPDNNVRVLLKNGKKTAYPYFFYDDITPQGTPLEVTEYLDSSMFDNDQRPNFSLCFDAPKAIFHESQVSQTSNYLYNLHHVIEMTTLNEGEVFTAYFHLSESDFQKLSRRLDWKIYIKDNGWFFISKVSKYNAIKKTLTKVELITADDLTKIKIVRPLPPISAGGKEPSINDYYGGVNDDTNIVYGTGNNDIRGRYNIVDGKNVQIFGDKNKVYSDNVSIIGNSNLVPQGKSGTRLINNGLEVEKVGTYIEGSTAFEDYKLTQTGQMPTTFQKLRYTNAELVNKSSNLFDTNNSHILKMPKNTLGEALVSFEVDGSTGSNPWVELQMRAYDDTDTLLFYKRSVTIPIVKNVSNFEISKALTFYFGDSEDIEYFEIWWRADAARSYTDPEITVKRF